MTMFKEIQKRKESRMIQKDGEAPGRMRDKPVKERFIKEKPSLSRENTAGDGLEGKIDKEALSAAMHYITPKDRTTSEAVSYTHLPPGFWGSFR